MENRLKERLTGAAILVALIVLLVPEMFRGLGGTSPPESGPTDSPPLRSYTIDLTNGPAAAPLQRTAGVIPPASTPPPVSTPPPAAAAPAPGSGAPVIPAAPEPASHADAPKAAVPAETPKAVPRPATTAIGWSVQLGLFAKRENAERLAHSAEAKGFTVRVSNPDAKGLYHVHTAALPQRTAALALQQRLKAQGFAAAVTAAQ
ncbi:MAG: SPOR domain-containing protein [Steroidobacterales bacterium]